MSIMKRPVRLGPIAAAEAAALKAAKKHEEALVALAEAGEQVSAVKHDLKAHAANKQQYAEALLEDAKNLKAASNLLTFGQTDSQVREVFAPVK